MIDLTNKKTAGVILAATLASGVATGRLTSPAISSSVKPVAMRWLNDGGGKPFRYAIAVEIKVGKGSGGREIICSADGVPRLDGQNEGEVFENATAKQICADTIKYGTTVTKYVSVIAADIVK